MHFLYLASFTQRHQSDRSMMLHVAGITSCLVSHCVDIQYACIHSPCEEHLDCWPYFLLL